MKLQDFANEVRSRKPEYSHLDDVDLIQMVAQKKPDLMQYIDRDDLAKTMNEVRKKQIAKERQKVFKSLSGVSRFGTGVEHGVVDTFMGIHQLLTGTGNKVREYLGIDIPSEEQEKFYGKYEPYKKEYKEMSEGDFASGLGELAGGLAVTAPIPGATGAKLAKNLPALAKAAVLTATGAGIGGLYGASEYVDEDETRLKNAAYGALFGAGGSLAGQLLKKVGAKAYNALKGKMKDASIQDLFDLSKKYDIPLPESAYTGKGAMTEKALGQIPVAGMSGFNQKGAKKTGAAIAKKAGEIGDDWDKTIQKSLQSKAKLGKAQANINYEKVNDLSGNVKVNPDNAINMAKFHRDKLSSGVMGSDVGSFETIIKNLEKGERTFEDLRQIRSELGKAARKATESGERDLGRRYGLIKKAIEYDIDDLVKGKVKGNVKPNAEDIKSYRKMMDPGEQYGSAMEELKAIDNYDSWIERMDGFGEKRGLVQRMANFVKLSGEKQSTKGNKLRFEEHIPADIFGESSDEVAKSFNMSENEFMEMLKNVPKKPQGSIPKVTKNLSSPGLNESDLKNIIPPKQGLMKAYKTAQSQYEKDVIPYTSKTILNDLKTESPDKIYSKYIKKGSGDDARNFYKLLDEKGKKALRDGFLDNAIVKPDGSYNSPAKIAGYIERMSKPGQAIFKGKDLEELKGFAKIMRHAERYGQLNESPSTGFGLIPFIKTGAVAAAGAGGVINPIATGAGVISAGALTKLMSLMKTKGVRYLLASDKIGSQKFEDGLQKIIAQLPKVSAITQKEIRE